MKICRKIKKTVITAGLISCTFYSLNAQRGNSFQSKSYGDMPFEPITSEIIEEAAPIKLDKEIVQNIYVSPGYGTYLEFPKDSEINKVEIGAKLMADITVDPSLNSLIIFPTVMNGSTNMFVVVDDVPYTFQVYIQAQGEFDQRITYTTKRKELEAVQFGPPLNPTKIDPMRYIQLVESYGRVKTPYPEHEMMNYKSLDKMQNHNGDFVLLSDAFGLPNENVVVLRVARRNMNVDQSTVLYASKIKVLVANKEIPVTLSTQSNAMLHPGQMEYIYLILQGYNVYADNDWRIQLPPTGKQLRDYLGK